VQNVLKQIQDTSNLLDDDSENFECESPLDCPVKKVVKELKQKGSFTLDKLTLGQKAVVKSVCESEPRLCCKLNSMGIVQGQEVTLKQRAPLGGDPISISTLGYTLSLRVCEAQAIEVERL